MEVVLHRTGGQVTPVQGEGGSLHLQMGHCTTSPVAVVVSTVWYPLGQYRSLHASSAVVLQTGHSLISQVQGEVLEILRHRPVNPPVVPSGH